MSVDSGDKGSWATEHLPHHWRWIPFSEFWTDHTDSKRKVQQNEYLADGAFPVIDQGASLIGGYSNDSTKKSLAPLPTNNFGDHTRATKYIDRPFIQGADGVRVLCAAPGVDPLFAYHALRCVQLPDKGYSRHFKFLKATQFPLAPLAEQRRIVTKIDSLFATSRRARDQLDHIPRLVEKYKQSILAAAFRGDLSQSRRKMPTPGAAPNLVPLSEICASITDGDHQAPPRAETGIPFITISAMNDGKIDLRKATRFVPRSYFDNLKSTKRPSDGDILYSVTGSFGIPALVDFEQPFVFQRHIAILKPDRRKVAVEFLFRMLAAPQILEQARSVATGTAQLTVPLSGLREFLLPFPTLNEQREVVRIIENAFAWIDRLASETTSARRLIDHLDQAVLSKAFRGELVPHDPTDEPTRMLLEQVGAERKVQSASDGSTVGKKQKLKRSRAS